MYKTGHHTFRVSRTGETLEGETLEVKITIEIEVGHMKDRIETEGTVEVLVTADQGQLQG